MLHGSCAGTQALRLRPWKLDVVPAPLTLEGQETSQAMFSEVGSGPVAAQAEAVHVKKERRVGGGGVLPSPGPPAPPPCSFWFSLPPPPPASFRGRKLLEGRLPHRKGSPHFWGVGTENGGSLP